VSDFLFAASQYIKHLQQQIEAANSTAESAVAFLKQVGGPQSVICVF
jgi:hypothetical protein